MNAHGRFGQLSVNLLVALSVLSPSYAGASDRRTAALASRAQTPGIFNFGAINDTYFRGAELDVQAAATLAARGIKTVVDLRSDADYTPSEKAFVTAAGMRYARIPMTTRVAPTPAQVSTFLALVTDSVNLPVYVHCVEGRHRTGVMTAVYRMAVDGWTAARAFREMKDFKFGLDFLHPEFKKFVYRYQPAQQAAATSAAIADATN